MTPTEPQDPRAATDASLVAASINDAGSFRVVYDRHAESVYAVALRRCGDRDLALDLTAETFARAWAGRGRFRDDRSGSALPWLFGILRNVVRASARERRLADEGLQALGLATRADSQVDWSADDWIGGLDHDIESALAALSPQQRRAVEMRVVEDHPYRAIATALDCSEGAARTKVSRGLAGLRSTLTTSEGAQHDH